VERGPRWRRRARRWRTAPPTWASSTHAATPGLNPTFRVVFSGFYADARAAQAAAADVSGAYPLSYVRQIAAPLQRWPATRRGWTVVLASVPAGRGAREDARAKATEASALGLPRVGVLSTDDFATLNPGYLVVYSGVYRTQARAQAAAQAARARFASAYPRLIAP